MTELLAGLAAYRASRLVVSDTIFDDYRLGWQLSAHNVHPKLHELISCGYCISVWFAFFFVLAGRRRRAGFLVSWLAAAGVAAVAWSIDERASS